MFNLNVWKVIMLKTLHIHCNLKKEGSKAVKDSLKDRRSCKIILNTVVVLLFRKAVRPVGKFASVKDGIHSGLCIMPLRAERA